MNVTIANPSRTTPLQERVTLQTRHGRDSSWCKAVPLAIEQVERVAIRQGQHRGVSFGKGRYQDQPANVMQKAGGESALFGKRAGPSQFRAPLRC